MQEHAADELLRRDRKVLTTTRPETDRFFADVQQSVIGDAHAVGEPLQAAVGAQVHLTAEDFCPAVGGGAQGLALHVAGRVRLAKKRRAEPLR